MNLSSEDLTFLEALSRLTYCNPFEPERIELERSVLGDEYTTENVASWSRTEATDRHERPNVVRITQRAGQLAERLRDKQASGNPLEGDAARLYDDLVTYVLYYRHVGKSEQAAIKPMWRAFASGRDDFFAPLAPSTRPSREESAHLFACLHQVRRAFTNTFDYLVGESAPATRLRAQVWQSIFTHDLRRYRRALYGRMSDLTTLVTGPSGAGKELVARAIGLSQYRAFDPEAERFVGDVRGQQAFAALNLSSLSPTLIESELFGHRRGSFTGAATDRIGWLEQCPDHGAVFLDEIGELDPALQVKLLRVVQTRDYSRLGESESRRFGGKLIAATNRDLAAEMRAGRFREDFYYRLCSDRIIVPSLGDHLTDRPEAIEGLVRYLARRVLGDDEAADEEIDALASETLEWIGSRMPAGYGWPGNIRELEQCVRNVLVRREYHPPSDRLPPRDRQEAWVDRAQRGELTADELLAHYCRLVHQQAGGYEQAARRLGLDRRTVKRRASEVDGLESL